MKKLILGLFMIVSLLSFDQTNAQDNVDTTYYNTVRVTSSNGTLISKCVFTYDTDYDCDNNIKIYNYQDSGSFTIRVWFNGNLYLRKTVWLVGGGRYTYLNDVIRNCNSSVQNISVRVDYNGR